MPINWTPQQQKVIDLRNRSLLVSAAAGSGKTAVLVRRIIRKVTDPEHPLDIDRLLVMTFTRAAAAEMKERLMHALEEELMARPDSDHLQRQMNLIHTAQINTIDGFCSWLLHEYFHLIGLDPGFRTADEGELKLHREAVMDALLEDWSRDGGEEYRNFAQSFSPGKSDDRIGELIQRLYDASMSQPYPGKWLEKCAEGFETTEPERPELMNALWDNTGKILQEAEETIKTARDLCFSPGGPVFYADALDADLLILRDLKSLADAGNYDGLSESLENLQYTALSRKKMPDAAEELKEQVKSLRQETKDLLKQLKEDYFFQSTELHVRDRERALGSIRMLVRLTEDFARRFAALKKERNILDFSDMEHFALDILQSRDGVRTEAARELSLKFDEIMIDEYQDSNLVQEYIARAVSGWAAEKENLFMVGDVKQSIYRFRLARPELFMEKFRTYPLQDGPRQRIDLHQNFRSRPQVLDSVNYIFRQIMGEDLGGIAYDDEAALREGASYPVLPEDEGGKAWQTEVLLIDAPDPDTETEQTMQELEAAAVAQRIGQMVGKEYIRDASTGGLRPVRLGDIAILLRTAAGWAEIYMEALASRNIPCVTASRTGYFSALEVVQTLNYLRICDNPMQDIPLTGVLLSPMGGLTAQELALLRVAKPDGLVYESIQDFLADGADSGTDAAEKAIAGRKQDPAEEREAHDQKEETVILRKKLIDFTLRLDRMRAMAVYTPIHRLIQTVLDETGYMEYASAMPQGAQRRANLQMLVQRAKEYEKTSFRGLFSFIRYIEHLEKYEIDYGEVNLASDEDNSVKLMTIHKSKGLEFPVVFVCGMGKNFNFQDLNQSVLIHSDLGIGLDLVDVNRRTRHAGLAKKLIRARLKEETLGEELRVLYVAMTRAKEKLILAGIPGDLSAAASGMTLVTGRKQELLSWGTRYGARSFLQFLLPALARHRCMKELLVKEGYFPARQDALYTDPAEFSVRVLPPEDLVPGEILRQTDRSALQREFEKIELNRIYDEKINTELSERLDFSYAFDYLQTLPAKISVSELKKRSWAEPGEPVEERYSEPDVIPLIPSFIQENQKKLTGADRGTAYHRLMELLDYRKLDVPDTTDDAADNRLRDRLREITAELQAEKKMDDLQIQSVSLRDIAAFLHTPLGRRMHRAAHAGKLLREQPFVFARPARELDTEWPYDDPVLIQGIIGAYFFEEDDIILVDYKTDRLQPGEEQILADKYRVQLEDYAAALEQMTGHRVRERWLYSFSLGREILC